MSVRLEMKYGFHLFLEQRTPCLEIEITGETKLRELLENIDIAVEKVWMVFINDERAGIDHIVRDNDNIVLYPPIDGG